MPKATDADKDRFRSLMPSGEGVEVKPMFGQLGGFVNGNMFVGMFGASIGVKLDPAAASELASLPGAGPFGPEGRPMGGYTAVPDGMADADVAEWIARALDHVGAMPPKVKKAR